MRKNNVMGVLFSNRHDSCLSALTAARPLGAVPFGGRYRLIDFTLSNLVHAGISKVGIVTKNNYQSLMDHIGSGKSWDLSRKNEGLYFLPPFTMNDDLYAGRVASLNGIRPFFRNSRDEYVILSDCNVAGNIDFSKMLSRHMESGADITVMCKRGLAPHYDDNVILTMDDDRRVNDVVLGQGSRSECDFGLGTYVMRKDLLIRLVDSAYSRDQMNFERDILIKNLSYLRIFGYSVPEYVEVIHSPSSFFSANMALLDTSKRYEMFNASRPVYTKVRDSSPAIYGLHTAVNNSLIADGCFVEGTVRNSILFRDVRIAAGAVVENSIVMQGSIICDGASLCNVVIDKDVVVRADRALRGTAEYPTFIGKGTIV